METKIEQEDSQKTTNSSQGVIESVFNIGARRGSYVWLIDEKMHIKETGTGSKFQIELNRIIL
jgi:hypothetical protein